jgi:hypothetical protein
VQELQNESPASGFECCTEVALCSPTTNSTAFVDFMRSSEHRQAPVTPELLKEVSNSDPHLH